MKVRNIFKFQSNQYLQKKIIKSTVWIQMNPKIGQFHLNPTKGLNQSSCTARSCVWNSGIEVVGTKITMFRIYICSVVRPRHLIAKYKQLTHEFEGISEDYEVEAELFTDVPTKFPILTQLCEIPLSWHNLPSVKAKPSQLNPWCQPERFPSTRPRSNSRPRDLHPWLVSEGD